MTINPMRPIWVFLGINFFFLNFVLALPLFRGFVAVQPSGTEAGPILKNEVVVKSYSELVSRLSGSEFSYIQNSNPITAARPGFYISDSKKKDFFVASRINIQAYINHNSVLAWVYDSQNETGPLQKVLNLYDCRFKLVAQKKTDKNGFAKFNRVQMNPNCPKGFENYFLVSTDKEDYGFLNLSWSYGFEKWRYPVLLNSKGEKDLTEKNIRTILPTAAYFPGQTVYIHHQIINCSKSPKFVRLKSIKSNFFYETKLKDCQNYTNFSTLIKLPSDLKPDVFEVVYADDLRNETYSSAYVTVLKKVDYETDLIRSLPTQAFLFSDDKILVPFRLDERKKNDSPSAAKKVKVTVTAFLTPSSFKFENKNLSDKALQQTQDYVFQYTREDQLSQNKVCKETLGQQTNWIKSFDVQSGQKIKLELPKPELCGEQAELQLTYQVIEAGKPPRHYTDTLQLLPSRYIIGIKKTQGATKSGIQINTLVWDLKENKVAPLEIDFKTFLGRIYLNRKKLLGGNYSLDPLTATFEIKNVCQPVGFSDALIKCDLTGYENETMQFEASLTDPNKKTVHFKIPLSNGNQTYPKNKNVSAKQIHMFADKAVYSPGQVAKLSVSVPFKKAFGTVIIEKDKVLESYSVELSSQRPFIEIPIKPSYQPNVFVSLILHRPQISGDLSSYSKSLATEQVKLAIAEFKVSTKIAPAFQLSVDDKETPSGRVVVANISGLTELTRAQKRKMDFLIYTIKASAFSQLEPRTFYSELDTSQMKSYQSQLATMQAMHIGAGDSAVRLTILGDVFQTQWSPFYETSQTPPISNWFSQIKLNQNFEINQPLILDKSSVKDPMMIVVKGFLPGYPELTRTFFLPKSKGEVFQKVKLEPASNPIESFQDDELTKQVQINFPKSTASKNNAFLKLQDDFIPSDKYVLDRDQKVLGLKRISFNQRKLMWQTYDQIPKSFVDLLLKAEDKNFFDHRGVDWLALSSATLKFIEDNPAATRRGASTLSMQLVNLLSPTLKGKKKTIKDKYEQINLTLELEKTWTKKEILEAYLNLIPLKGDIVGIGSGAYFFFNKLPQDLNPEESAFLIAVIPSPNASVDKFKQRFCSIIQEKNCRSFDKFITKTFANFQENKSFVGMPFIQSNRTVVEENKNVVKTTLKADLQTQARHVLQNHIRRFSNQNLRDGAIVIFNNVTKEVIVHVANSGGQYSDNEFVDHAAALRQPGSTMKTFVYAAAIERKKINLNTLIEDKPISLLESENESYSPRNFDLKNHGLVSIAEALGASLNIPAVKVMTAVDEKYLFSKLRRLGFTSIDQNKKYGPAFALGSAEVSLFELTEGYMNLFTGSVFNPNTVDQLKLALSEPMYRKIPYYIPNNRLMTTTPIVFKTGTSSDTRDVWSIAVSDQYTVGVWLGNSDRQAPWHIGNFNAVGLMQNLFLTLEDLQVSSIKSPYKAAEAIPTYFEKDKDIRIDYPYDQSHLAKDPEIPDHLQKIPIQIENVSQVKKVIANGETLLGSESYVMDPKNGKNKVEIFDQTGKLVDQVEFWYND